MEKINTNDFAAKFAELRDEAALNKNGDVSSIGDFLREYCHKEYRMPYETKIKLAKEIADYTLFYKDEDGQTHFNCNSSRKHIYSTLIILRYYTDIDINIEGGIDEYSIIENNSLLRIIMTSDLIDQEDIEEFKSIIDQTVDDWVLNLQMAMYSKK